MVKVEDQSPEADRAFLMNDKRIVPEKDLRCRVAVLLQPLGDAPHIRVKRTADLGNIQKSLQDMCIPGSDPRVDIWVSGHLGLPYESFHPGQCQNLPEKTSIEKSVQLSLLQKL